MKTEISELRLQQNCYVELHNHYPHLRGLFFRIKNEGTNRITGAIDRASGVIPGVADSCLLLPGGAAVFIEFKTPTGKQSQKQQEWQRIIEAAGFEYYVIKTLEEFKELLTKLLTPQQP